MSGLGGAALAVLFFAPLAFIYGRTLAGRLQARARADGRSVAALALPKLVLPALVAGALLFRLNAPAPGAEGSPTLGAALGVLWFLGSAAAILFFVAIPFVLGRVFGVAAALAGRFAGAGGNPLGFGANGYGDGEGADGQEGRGVETTMRDGKRGAGMGRAMVIAIDGPAAAGKGTLAQRLARHYGLGYLDTGLLYRAVGRLALERGADLDSEAEAGAVARDLVPSHLDDGSLRGREAGELASRVAVHPGVRAALADFQRDFARRPGGAVLDGRDIGTVICPDADVKIFVTASAEVRARRRTAELAAKGRDVAYETILAEVRERDARDANRAAAPLRPAPDARLLDTSELDIEDAFRAACDMIDATPPGT